MKAFTGIWPYFKLTVASAMMLWYWFCILIFTLWHICMHAYTPIKSKQPFGFLNMSGGIIIVSEWIKNTKTSSNASFVSQFDPQMCVLSFSLFGLEFCLPFG
jgi:hypothetical protein